MKRWRWPGDARAVVGAVAVLGALGGAAMFAWPNFSADSKSDSAPRTEVIRVPTETLPPVVPVAPVAAADVLAMAPGSQTVESSIGTITWSRIIGDSSSLPSRIIGSDGVTIHGADDAEVRWISTDGTNWEREGDDEVRRLAGGVSWVQRTVDGERRLSRVAAEREIPASADAPTPAPQEGFVTAVEIVGPADGFPIVLGGGIYVLSNVRIGLPWAQISGSGTDAHRVAVTYGERTFTSVAGDFHEMPVTNLEMRATNLEMRATNVEMRATNVEMRATNVEMRATNADDTFELLNVDGDIVWTLGLPPDVGQSPIDAIRDQNSSQWLAWDGQRFVAADTPWPGDYEVEVVPVAGGAVARSQAAHGDDVALWRTTDGRGWQRVALPENASTDLPVAMVRGDGEMTFTIWIDDAPTFWSTIDGSALVSLPDVPGITERSRGSFGWVAPDPRSAPTIRVSSDGEVWEEIDVGDLIGYDASYWDLTIHARAVGSKILVVAERQGTRTLLIGQVMPSS